MAYLYTKQRSEFGKDCKFSNGKTEVLENILPTKEFDKCYKLREVTATQFDTTPDMSETEVNTERVVVKNGSMRHTEGGWPKDVDFTEQSDVSRFRKKAEKDEEYQNAIGTLGPLVERCMKQNSTVNIYETYFEDVKTDHSSEPPSAKGLAVFRDPSEVKRTASSIDWHPDGTSIAVSYSILNFQDNRFDDPKMLPTVSSA